MRLSLDAAHALALGALTRAGVSPANAEFVATALVAAEADGLASHGLSRVPAYADQAKAGKVNGTVEPLVRTTGTGAVMVDARDGFAFPPSPPALRAPKRWRRVRASSASASRTRITPAWSAITSSRWPSVDWWRWRWAIRRRASRRGRRQGAVRHQPDRVRLPT